ncbi:MAG TPA: metallophosphoesterase family protein [Polyangia bacterium]|nr:metallophosphoesterase family protein [Polyangia bacterium]
MSLVARGARASALAFLVVATATGCRDRAARFMRVDAGTAPPPEARAEEPNQVHFSFTGPTSAAFFWRGSNRTMRIWSRDMAPRVIEAHTPDPEPFSTAGRWQEAIVTDLRPGTEYGYEVGKPSVPVPSLFHTPPPSGAPFSFVAMADVGASVDFGDVPALHRLVATTDPDFVLGLGDLTLADIRSQASVDRHFEDVMVWSRKAAYMPVWGEHEWATPARDDFRNYKGRFAMPNPQASPGAPKVGGAGEDWYWFDYGNVRFISYPEPYAAETLDDWSAKATPIFAAAEADPAITLVVTVGHRAAYSSAGGDAASAPLRKLLDGFGARFPKYVLNLAGHGYGYERSQPISHVVHVTTPPGAGDLPHADTPCGWPDCKVPATTAFRAIHHGLLHVLVRGDAITVEAFCLGSAPGREDMRCADGDIFDRAVIAKGASPPSRAPPKR